MSYRGPERPSVVMSRRDLEFLLFEWLDTEDLLRRDHFAEHSRETVEAVLTLAETLATAEFAPHNRASDLQEPTFDGEKVEVVPEVGTALRSFAESGFIAAPLDVEVGGMGLPQSVFGGAWHGSTRRTPAPPGTRC